MWPKPTSLYMLKDVLEKFILAGVHLVNIFQIAFHYFSFLESFCWSHEPEAKKQSPLRHQDMFISGSVFCDYGRVQARERSQSRVGS